MMTARYLLEHPEYDANWESHVRGLITWVENTFAVPSYGANTIAEQIAFLSPDGKPYLTLCLRKCAAVRKNR